MLPLLPFRMTEHVVINVFQRMCQEESKNKFYDSTLMIIQ